MKRIWQGALVVALLGSCGGENAFLQDDSTTTTSTSTGTGVTGDRTIPPGTASPTSATGVFRTEPTAAAGGENGDGYVTDVSYDATADTFTVDNLSFDGNNTYARGTAVSSLGPYAVYEAAAQFPATGTGTAINQLTHRAIYGVATSGTARFAIVRTGSYVDYGFGGFVYQRDGGVTLPTSGQAIYTGTVAGMRDFSGASGLQYTSGDIQIAIDYDDFNATDTTRAGAVRGTISNREVFDLNGNDITQTVVSAINTDANASLTAIPSLIFAVEPGALDSNGEILGTLGSTFVNDNGEVTEFETGKYYALVSGSSADEIVGVVVATTSVGLANGAARDTGGFVVYKQ